MTTRAQLEAIRPNTDRLLASDNSGRVAGVILTLRFAIIVIVTVIIILIIVVSKNLGKVAGIILMIRFVIIIIISVASNNLGRVAAIFLTFRFVEPAIIIVFVVVFVIVLIKITFSNIPVTFLFFLEHEERIRKTSSLATLHLGMEYLRCKPLSNGIG